MSSLPMAFENPVTMRASAALEAAGAWDTPTIQACPGAMRVMLSLTYTRGAAGGAFDYQIQGSIYGVVGNVPTGAGEWSDGTLYESGAIVAGADTQSRVQREYDTYQATGAAAETFLFGPIELGMAVERIRIRTRESGVVGTPGTLVIGANFMFDLPRS